MTNRSPLIAFLLFSTLILIQSQNCNSRQYLFNNRCFTCPVATTTGFKNSATSCICRFAGTTWDLASGNCVCALGSVLKAGVCVSCSSLALTDTQASNTVLQSCTCVQGAVWSRTALTCSCDGTAKMVRSGISSCSLCNAIPNSNGVFANNGCGCTTGYGWTVSNSIGSCVCNRPGYILSNTYGCVLCTDSRVGGTGRTGNTCNCANNAVYDSTVGYCKCPTNMVMLRVRNTNQCMCDASAGYVWNLGRCVLCTSSAINGSPTIDPQVNTY
jgi:hypothetical protein